MDWHAGFNYAVGALATILAYFSRQFHYDLREAKTQISDLSLLMARDYVHKDSLAKLSDNIDRLSDILFKKLDRIEDKMDKKEDKP